MPGGYYAPSGLRPAVHESWGGTVEYDLWTDPPAAQKDQGPPYRTLTSS